MQDILQSLEFINIFVLQSKHLFIPFILSIFLPFSFIFLHFCFIFLPSYVILSLFNFSNSISFSNIFILLLNRIEELERDHGIYIEIEKQSHTLEQLKIINVNQLLTITENMAD